MEKTIKNILVICGPTASGKTSLAISVAKLLPKANILSADSRQIYKGLDILTGKDIPNDLPSSIIIYGLDLIASNKIFNLSDFVDYAGKIINKSLENNTPLIIVGGTGLYLKATTSNLLNVHVPPNSKLRAKLEKMNLVDLKKLLCEIAPKKFASLNNSDINNPRRLIRAIEIASSSNQVGILTESNSPDIKFHWIGLRVDNIIQENNIRERVLHRIKRGAIEEVLELIKKYPDTSFPVHSSLGVKYVKAYLDRKITKEECVDLWTKAEVDYARRQIVWFKKQHEIVWYDKGSINQDSIKSLSALIL